MHAHGFNRRRDRATSSDDKGGSHDRSHPPHRLSAAAATACALGAGAPASPTRAAAPPAGKQAPGFYRYKVGDIEVTAVTDGANVFTLPDSFIVNDKKDEVNAALAAAIATTAR